MCNVVLFVKGDGGGTWFGAEIMSSDPTSKVANGLGYFFIAYVIQPGMATFAAVAAGREVAPRFSKVVGWIISAILITGIVVLFLALFRASDGQIHQSLWIGYIAAVIGVFVGALIKFKDKENEGKVDSREVN